MSRRTSTSLHRGAAPRAPRILGAVAAATLVIGAGALLNASTASATGSAPTLALGSASTFSVLAGAATTIPGATISGDVGANAALTISGSAISGTTHASADAATGTALTDATTAYNQGVALAAGAPAIPGDDLGGVTLTPGAYHNVAALADTGTVTFDAGGDPNAVFVIATDAALNTTASTTMVLANSAQAANIYFVSAGAATLGASSTFDGNIISAAAVTVGASSTVVGRALSTTAAVTLGASVTLAGVTGTTVPAPVGPAPASSSSNSTVAQPDFKDAANFSVLAGAAVTLPNSSISGDVGAGAALTISNPAGVLGAVHTSADGVTTSALTSLSAAYTNLMALPFTKTILGDDLGGQTITPGVSHNAAALAVTGNVVFDALGHPDAVFVIQTDAALNTTASTTMSLTGGAQPSNIYFVSTGAATLGASSTFYGSIVSNAAVTVGASSNVIGTVMSVTAAVTLGDSVAISASADVTNVSLARKISANAKKVKVPRVKGYNVRNFKIRYCA